MKLKEKYLKKTGHKHLYDLKTRVVGTKIKTTLECIYCGKKDKRYSY